MTLSDYMTALGFMANGIQPWDDWVEEDSGLTNYVRSRRQRQMLSGLG